MSYLWNGSVSRKYRNGRWMALLWDGEPTRLKCCQRVPGTFFGINNYSGDDAGMTEIPVIRLSLLLFFTREEAMSEHPFQPQ